MYCKTPGMGAQIETKMMTVLCHWCRGCLVLDLLPNANGTAGLGTAQSHRHTDTHTDRHRQTHGIPAHVPAAPGATMTAEGTGALRAAGLCAAELCYSLLCSFPSQRSCQQNLLSSELPPQDAGWVLLCLLCHQWTCNLWQLIPANVFFWGCFFFLLCKDLGWFLCGGDWSTLSGFYPF